MPFARADLVQASGNSFAVGSWNQYTILEAPQATSGAPHGPDAADATREAVHAVRRRFLRRGKSVRPPFGMAARPHAQELVDRLVAGDGPATFVCEGPAGMGKSAVVEEVIGQVADRGWPVLPFRMDEVEADDRTAEAVGSRLRLPGSPAALIVQVAQGGPALLVVDQLDAVSSYSGRIPEVFEAVDEMLETLADSPNVKVVLVARTVDVEKDPRLTSLVDKKDTVARFVLGLLDDQAVRAVLERGSTPPEKLDTETLALLRTPLHLAVFSRLTKGARTTAYRSLQDLYAQYTEDQRHAAERTLPPEGWPAITQQLVEEMSRRETVTVPFALLDRFPRAHLAVLCSAGTLLHAENGRIGFFHETYFDYLFARSFVLAGHDLHDFLAASGQALFRRAQTRQVLEHLRDTDRTAFRHTAVRLLTSDLVRPHLRFVVVAVLEQLDATSEDWATLEPLAWGEDVTSGNLRRLLALPSWFEAADTGRWERWLATPEVVPLVLPQLEWGTPHHPARITELLEPYLDAEDPWGQRLLSWVQSWPSVHALGLTLALIDRGAFDVTPDGPSDTEADFWYLFEQLAQEDAGVALQVLGAFLTRGLQQAAAAGHGDPFASGHLRIRIGSSAGTFITEAAEAAPTAALEHVLPFVVAVAKSSHAALSHVSLLRPRWALPPSKLQPDLDEALYWTTHDSMRTLAQQNPSVVTGAMGTLTAAGDNRALNFLACRTYAVWNRPDEALVWLMSDPEHLRIGWADSACWASRELIAAAARRCKDTTLEQLVQLLIGHFPRWERQSEGRRLFGRAQYVLLGAVDEKRRSAAVERRLGELERKFGQHPPVGPRNSETADWVGPPVPRSAAEHMTDDQWLGALRKYAAEGINWEGDVPTGGATELASMLRAVAGQEPQRFVRLALIFDETVPAPAFAAVIDGVAGKVDADLLLRLCSHARHLVGKGLARTICQAIETAASDVVGHAALVGLLVDCVDHPDPAVEAARSGAEPGQDPYGGDLLTAGLNSTRGQSALALGALLRASDTVTQGLVPLLGRLAVDPIMAVRVCAAEAVAALLRHAPEAALDLAESLFTGTPIDIHEARTTHWLLTWTLIRDTRRFAPELLRALDGTEEAARHAGATWAVLSMQGRLLPCLPTDLTGLTTAARQGAAATAAGDPAYGASLLQEMFQDSDAAVRTAAARAMSDVMSLSPGAADSLIGAFLGSPALAEHPDTLARALAQSAARLPSGAIEACQALAVVSERNSREGRHSYALIQRYLTEAVLRLYRQGDVKVRTQCLDIIDALYRTGAHGLTAALSGER
ncbi:ATP-binding protein [Streptomyces sp. NPDC006552]|uniref:ATP-binding protein n=1 Tax=Streptomyces sp. NPDC006552 TaxID=3157179 RepID=UPI0033B358D4